MTLMKLGLDFLFTDLSEHLGIYLGWPLHLIFDSRSWVT